VAGADNPGMGPYNDGFFYTVHNTGDPSTSYVTAGWDDSSAIATISFAEIGIGVATFGQGIWGMAAKELGKVVTDNASDAGYTGSIMEMEGFTIGLDGILKANNYYYDGTAP
jgi:hypothetical protein